MPLIRLSYFLSFILGLGSIFPKFHLISFVTGVDKIYEFFGLSKFYFISCKSIWFKHILVCSCRCVWFLFIYLFYFHLELGRDKKGFIFVKENGYGKRGPTWIFLLKIPKWRGSHWLLLRTPKMKGTIVDFCYMN